MASAQELLPKKGDILVDVKSGFVWIGDKNYPDITRVSLFRGKDEKYSMGISLGQGGGICIPVEDPQVDIFSRVDDVIHK